MLALDGDIVEIDILNKMDSAAHGDIVLAFYRPASSVYFAETRMNYSKSDLDQLIEDYYVVKLSGIKQV